MPHTILHGWGGGRGGNAPTIIWSATAKRLYIAAFSQYKNVYNTRRHSIPRRRNLGDSDLEDDGP